MKRICGIIKNYDWGTDCMDSQLVLLSLLGGHINFFNPDLNYAELWLATAKNNVSVYYDTKENINTKLPYLFKILSIKKPLSIQIHPDKNIAEYLHLTKPDIYPDDNHKPEMAIAYPNLEALSGIRDDTEILEILKDYPELDISPYNLFESLLNIQENIIINIINRIKNKNIKTLIDNLILYINKSFEYDVGVLAPIYMNYVKLNKFEALVIKPNTPHVYLKGNIIECMATSDNVIRLALSSKIKDVESLKLIPIKKKLQKIDPIILDNRYSYITTINEFNIYIYIINGNQEIDILKNSIVFILDGFGLINDICYLKGSAFINETKNIVKFYSPNMTIVLVSPN